MANMSKSMLKIIFKEVFGEISLPPKMHKRGRPSIPLESMVKAFVLMFLRGLSSERSLERYLRDHPEEASLCGFKAVPWHSTFSRFRRRMGEGFFRGLFNRAEEALKKELPFRIAIVDSSPIIKPKDPDAKMGFYSRGAFKGFKVHASSCENGLPRSAEVTAGNCHDSPIMPRLIKDMGSLEAVVGDSGYDSEENYRCIMEHGAIPVIGRNKRNEKEGKLKKEIPFATTLP